MTYRLKGTCVASEMEFLPTASGSSGAEASNLGYFSGSLVAEAATYPHRGDGLMSGDITRTVEGGNLYRAQVRLLSTTPNLILRNT